jgi:hypothetical protein
MILGFDGILKVDFVRSSGVDMYREHICKARAGHESARGGDSHVNNSTAKGSELWGTFSKHTLAKMHLNQSFSHTSQQRRL